MKIVKAIQICAGFFSMNPVKMKIILTKIAFLRANNVGISTLFFFESFLSRSFAAYASK